MSIRRATSSLLPLAIAFLAILGCITFYGVGFYYEARDAAVRSYVRSVCSAVEEYRVQNGRYPTELDQINTSTLDYDVNIPLSALKYELNESEMNVSYSSEDGDTISFKSPIAVD